MKKENILPPVIIEIKPSKLIKGEIGVFATRDLIKGTAISDSHRMEEDNFVSWEDFENLDEITQKKVMDYCLGTPEGFHTINDLNYLSVPWNMNHSCDGNVGFDENDEFITIKDVKKGEELCWDYGLAETNPNFRMECKCGSKNCRKIITGSDWKSLITDENKKNFILKELIK